VSRRGAVPVRLAALAAAVLLALACGGGGGGGGGPTGPPPVVQRITFTPTGGGATSAVTLTSGAGSTATNLVLEIRANQVGDLYGLSFDLTYPQGLLRYDSATEGTVLSQGGAPTSLLINSSTAGNLVVGLSRLGAVSGVDASGVLLTLRFTAVGSGTGTFGFSRNSAVDSTGDGLSLSWGGGNVEVVL
jgi:hypothetical protein